jgi:ribonuclease P protein component
MFDAENESMGSGRVSEPGEGAPSSGAVAARVGAGSRRSFRPLRGRVRFSRVYKAGVVRRQGALTVHAAPGHGIPEVGIVASRKQVGGAVDRNRARRRIRAALERLPLSEGSYIVVTSREVLKAPFEELVRWLEAAVKEERE